MVGLIFNNKKSKKSYPNWIRSFGDIVIAIRLGEVYKYFFEIYLKNLAELD